MREYDDLAFVCAIDGEDQASAAAMVRFAIDGKLEIADLFDTASGRLAALATTPTSVTR